ncbi:MAG: nitroreductase family protein [Selenomonadales bacterium]|nr:nitroreductase family protein [Selenomonadales bacterium]
MELMDTMLKRRSIRQYTDEAIPADKLKRILQAGLIAPTSMNRKPCEMIVVQDKAMLQKLSQVKEYGSAMIADCHTAIVVIASEQKADTWIEDSSIALSYMSLAATDLGIGNCWCQIHLRVTGEGMCAEQAVRQLLKLADEYRIVGILPLGIPAVEMKPHAWDEADMTKVHGWKAE